MENARFIAAETWQQGVETALPYEGDSTFLNSL